MYFEPTRKTYYRFPSHSSAQNFEERHYYPDKQYASSEDMRYTSQVTEQDNHSDISHQF